MGIKFSKTQFAFAQLVILAYAGQCPCESCRYRRASATKALARLRAK